MKHFPKRLVLLTPVLLFTNCANKWVKKPEVEVVKKLAIVSLASNQHIHRLGDSAEASGSGAAVLGNALGKQTSENDARTAILMHASKTLTNSLGTVPGWKIVPAEEVIKMPAYQEAMAVKSGNATVNAVFGFMNKVASATKYASLPGMTPITLTEVQASTGSPTGAGGGRSRGMEMSDQSDAANEIQKLKKLAVALNVDAVAVVNLNLTYKSGSWPGGGYVGNPILKTEMDVITKEGLTAVRTDRISQNAQAFTSDKNVPALSKSQMNIDAAVEPYKKLIDQNTEAMVQRIKTELAGT